MTQHSSAGWIFTVHGCYGAMDNVNKQAHKQASERENKPASKQASNQPTQRVWHDMLRSNELDKNLHRVITDRSQHLHTSMTDTALA